MNCKVPAGVAVGVLLLGLLGGRLAVGQEHPAGKALSGSDLTRMVGAAVILDATLPDEGWLASIALGRHGWAFFVYVSGWGTGDQMAGRWYLEGDALCLRLRGERDPRCARHYDLGDGRFAMWSVPDARPVGTYRVRKPDPVE